MPRGSGLPIPTRAEPFLTSPHRPDASNPLRRPESRPAVRELERQRLRAVERSRLLDSGAEERFDRITREARARFGVPLSIISFIAEDRQFFKSFVGSMPRNIPREIAFCNATIRQEEPLVVPDLLDDARFSGHPFVSGAPFVRFYAGVALRGPGGWFVGSICILDTEPRVLGPHDLLRLRRFAEAAELEVNSAP